MKNLKFIYLTIMLLLTMSISGYSQEENQPKETETERIIDKYGEKIIDGFNSTVEKITPYAEEGFKMVVRLQIAKGIGHLLPILPLILILLYLNPVIKKSEWSRTGDTNNGWAILQIILWIGLLVFTILSITTVYKGILYLIAPEWFAIKEIIELLN